MSGNTGPRENGTQLRDARLTRALDHAPDVSEPAQPAVQRRDAILRAAHAAVQPPLVRPAVPRGRGVWAKLWDRVMGPGRMPWNAALVTVLLASFITLLWQGQPLPPAQIDPPIPAPSVPPAQETLDAAQPAQPAAAVQAPPAAPVADSAVEPRKPGRTANRAQAPRAPMAAPAAPTAPIASSEPADSAALSSVLRPPPQVAAEPPATAALRRERQDKLMLDERASSVPMATVLPQDWTDLRTAEGRMVARASTGDLPRLLASLQEGRVGSRGYAESLGSAAGAAKDVAAPVARLDLLRAGELLGSLELSGRHWQFVPRTGSGLTASQGVLDTAEAQALQAGMQRLGR